MNRARWYACGLVTGLVLVGATGSLRWTSGMAASATAMSAANVAAEPSPPDDGKLRIVAFGAHPDDCELQVGGTAILWADQGHHVKLVSTTNGDVGHWQMAGGPLARRRTQEVAAADKILGATSQVLDIHDGEIEPTLENRRTFTRVIRQWNADVVLGPRPFDYHPDHRYTGVLLQDSAFMVTVPYFCPETPALKKNPVFLYFSDGFQKPNPFKPDVVVSIDAVIERKAEALSQIVSQFIEGGCGGGPQLMPRDATELKARQEQYKLARVKPRYAGIADRFRDKLIELYGEEAGRQVRHAEAFEICEYGRRPTNQELRKLFPFIPNKK